MTRILLSGDSHADISHVGAMHAKAKKFDCDKIFILGDYGWWPKDKKGMKFVEACSDMNMPVYFLPGNHECVSSDTRAITKRGFISYDELRDDDEVLSVDDDDEAIWLPIEEIIINNYQGEMVQAFSRSVDMLMTPRHRVVYKNYKTQWKEHLAEDWDHVEPNMIKLVVSGLNSKEDYDISDDLITLFGWSMTDAGFTKGYWQYYQRKPNIQKITDTLHNLQIEFNYYERFREIHEICGKPTKSNYPECTLSLSKEDSYNLPWDMTKDVFPEWVWKLSERQVKIFIDTVTDGDGSLSTDGKTSGVIYCSYIPLLENLMLLMIQNGYRVKVSEPVAGDIRLFYCKANTVSFDKSVQEKNNLYPKLSTVQYKGHVWCLKVPNGRFFVERNGKIALTGNCWEDLEKHEKYPDYNDEGFIEVYHNIYYAPTGFRWEWDGVKFLSVGGAYSIDRNHRVKFISWFPQEIITEEDIDKILVIESDFTHSVDIILSHDAPAGVDMAMEFACRFGDMKAFDLDSGTETNMQRLRWACDWWKPSHLYHGHWHLRYTQEHQFYDSFSRESYDIMITGLNCNQTGGEAFHVLDTKDIK